MPFAAVDINAALTREPNDCLPFSIAGKCHLHRLLRQQQEIDREGEFTVFVFYFSTINKLFRQLSFFFTCEIVFPL